MCEKGDAQTSPFLQANNFNITYQPSMGYAITSQTTHFILNRIFFSECNDSKTHEVKFNESYILDYSVFEYGMSSCEKLNLFDKNKKTEIISLTSYKNDIINFQKEVSDTHLSTSETFIKK